MSDLSAYDDSCPDCTCCSAYRCHRGEGSGCPYSDSLGFVCPCTSDD